MARLLTIGILVVLLAPGGGPGKEARHWRVFGPGGGGAQFIPTVSPHDPRRVLVACDMTGAYVSHDGGQHWRMFNLRQPVSYFAFDPVAPDTVYANAAGLWRSEDAARTWQLVVPDPAEVTGLTLVGDHAEVVLNIRGAAAARRVTALAIDPADSRRLFAGMETEGRPGLFESADRGRSWQRIADLPDRGVKVFVDSRSPQVDRTLYVVGGSAVRRRQGGRWTQGETPAGETRLLEASLGFPTGDGPPTAYAVSARGLYVSDDGGMAWRPSPPPGEAPELVAVAACLRHPETAYASYRDLKIGGEKYFGVMRTSDGGRSWKAVWRDNQQPAANVKDAWLTEHFGPYFGEAPFNLGVAPDDPELCYGTDWGRTMRTRDGGKTWEAVYSRRLPDGSWASTGLDVKTCYGIHFDPFDRRRRFISYSDVGLFRSENGGSGWLPSTTGVPREWRNTTYWVEFDPQVKGRMWAATSQVHDLPRPKMWRNRGIPSFKGGVCRSDDGGRTWRAAGAGMPEGAVTHLLLDPRSPAGARTLYAAVLGRGVYKSTDGGEHWELRNHGLRGAEPLAWRLAADSRGGLVLVVARRSEDGRIGGDADGALYRSTNGGERWIPLPLPPDVNGPSGLAVDPANPDRLFLAAWSRPVSGKPVGGGIFATDDGGKSWRQVLKRDQHVYDVTLDPRHPGTLYASGFSSSAWKSVDRGRSWRRLRGFNFKWGHRVIPDPLDPASIYVTTFGGGLWHGPAEGDPTAAEDITTPVLRYDRQEGGD